jgi:hypothetical protein
MNAILANLLFRCPHRRLTRPITPVSKPGVPSGETYVVCLSCGQQFSYDWNTMRMGPPIKTSASTGVVPPDTPKPKVRYALLGAALPFAVLIGKSLFSKRPEKPAPTEGKEPAAQEEKKPARNRAAAARK